MTSDIIDFNLDDSTTIRITSEVKIALLHCCQNVDICLLKDNKKYLLGRDILREHMSMLKRALKKALHNQLQLHPSITEDIGIVFNQCLQDKPGPVYEKTGGQSFWVGDDYSLWNYKKFATWLYNDVDGNILLHITPIYQNRWTGEEDEEETNDRAYEKWMATKYKPLWTTILSPATAKDWLAQAEDIFSRLQYTDIYGEREN